MIREATAFRSNAFPSNPRPFVRALSELLEQGKMPEDDEFKAVLFIVNGMAYGQLGSISMMDEWDRLDKALPPN